MTITDTIQSLLVDTLENALTAVRDLCEEEIPREDLRTYLNQCRAEAAGSLLHAATLKELLEEARDSSHGLTFAEDRTALAILSPKGKTVFLFMGKMWQGSSAELEAVTSAASASKLPLRAITGRWEAQKDGDNFRINTRDGGPDIVFNTKKLSELLMLRDIVEKP